MGMTIDKAILQLEECKAYKQCDTEKDLYAFDVAINTMRKYQKIEEIVKQYKKFGNIDFSMQIISEVIEDENEK